MKNYLIDSILTCYEILDEECNENLHEALIFEAPSGDEIIGKVPQKIAVNAIAHSVQQAVSTGKIQTALDVLEQAVQDDIQDGHFKSLGSSNSSNTLKHMFNTYDKLLTSIGNAVSTLTSNTKQQYQNRVVALQQQLQLEKQFLINTYGVKL